ncbi:molybdopterin molybdotransferase MoeA [Flavivirga sp. 57AJ16]|uniref:molybdopterin molybdotransferase MoeA n=1 Tax=Flavivirga sp. 57AJ16 TaxID=3025307 RepID=UPI0023659F83|nr:molybdopterin molybdotransferase MoeA [Flavivirga sp. 57AJ16]MDD7887300.1 molybdopterin molybdotransferase MoeA [Flavivirga sp. 57AJ16]
MQEHNDIYDMVTINEAINAVKNNIPPLFKEENKPLEKCGGYHLSKDIVSPVNMPPFRQSAMDGYALFLHNDLSYSLIGEVKAGDRHQPTLRPGEAIRIFTGAPVPETANAIMMQEKVAVIGSKITLESHLPEGRNIRPMGEQVKTGDLALKQGTKLTPAAIGYLTSLGITQASVYKKPSIALITTGNELVEAGHPLTYGKIYESNSKMLLNALYNLKFYDVTIHKIADDYTQTKNKLETVIDDNDLVIVTGGISVGDYDFVGKALKELQVKEVFYKVKQKPGKPLFFGKKEGTAIFALPGNPAAALSCFYTYVYIALQKMMNKNTIELPRIKAKSISTFEKKGDRPQFLKAIYKDGEVEILEGQNSSMLQTFALSNALAFAPEDMTAININDDIELILLPV